MLLVLHGIHNSHVQFIVKNISNVKYIYYIKLKWRPSVHLSDRRTSNSAVSMWDLHYTIAISSGMCKFLSKSF